MQQSSIVASLALKGLSAHEARDKQEAILWPGAVAYSSVRGHLHEARFSPLKHFGVGRMLFLVDPIFVVDLHIGLLHVLRKAANAQQNLALFEESGDILASKSIFEKLLQ
jgi:hypothetical protein